MALKIYDEDDIRATIEAIREKLGTEELFDSTQMAEAVASISGKPDTFDIFYHGDVIGWADGFNTNYQSNKQDTAITISKFQLYRKRAANANLFLKNRPFTRGKYTKLKFAAEVPDGRTAPYNHADIGFRKASSAVPTWYSGGLDYAYKLVNYATTSNVAGSSPWYTLPYGIYEFDITNIPEDEEVILGFDLCDCGFNFYSIWLE